VSGSNEIGCTVLINGQPVNDGCVSTDPHVPTVLTGLKVEWGRASVVDQPQASTCTFTVLDPLTEPRLVPSLAMGQQIDVRVDTIIYPDPTVSTIPKIIPSGVAYATWTVAPDGKTGTVTGDAGTNGHLVGFTLPPLPYSDDPLAWDAVPRTLPGQDWRYTLTITEPAPFAGWSGWAAEVAPAYFVNPNGSEVEYGTWTVFPPGTPSSTVDITFTPPNGIWLGLAVHLYPVSPVWTQLDATTWNALGATPTWDGLATFGLSNLQVLAPAAGAAQSAFVFSGRITDVIARWDGGPDSFVDVIAQDWLAELANRYVGDIPWNMEPLGTRAQRIIQLSGQPIKLTVDPGPAALQVSYRDVDKQPAAGLLQQLATSSGSVLWTATHMVTGQVMRIEDVGARPAGKTLSDASGLVDVVPTPPANALPVTACNIDAEPVRFLLDTSDTFSMVAVQWLEQTTDPGPPVVQRPTQRTEELVDAADMTSIGARRLSISTQLAVQADARNQAAVRLARSSNIAWRIEDLTWDTADDRLGPDEIQTVMRLLDGTLRNGLPMMLTDLPPWVQPMTSNQNAVALYVEGGTYRYNAGAWELSVNTSNASGSAVGNMPWNALDADWYWNTFDPDVSWLDLYGVTYPAVV
jgi:hypothetical protein